MLDKENFEFIKNIDDLVKKATMLVNIFFRDKKDKGGAEGKKSERTLCVRVR